MRTVRLLALLVSVVALTGCAARYTLEGQTYRGAANFLEAVDTMNAQATGGIQPLPAPVSKKRLLFAVAGRDTIVAASISNVTKARGSAPSGLGLEMLTTLSNGNYRMIRVFGEGVAKRNIYQSVRIVDLDTMTPNLSASGDEDVLYMYESDPRSNAWYYVSQKGGKQLFSYDRSQPGAAAKVKSFVEAVQLQAIKE